MIAIQKSQEDLQLGLFLWGRSIADLVWGWVYSTGIHSDSQEIDPWNSQEAFFMLHLQAHGGEPLQYIVQVGRKFQRSGAAIRTSSKKGVTPGIPLSRESIRFWNIPGATLAPNCSPLVPDNSLHIFGGLIHRQLLVSLTRSSFPKTLAPASVERMWLTMGMS